MEKYMRMADEMAKQNVLTNNGGPFGAIIIKDDVIVGVGNNRVVGNNDPTAHAEMMAIRNACQNLNTFDLSGCTMITSCYPCPMCLSAIVWANIKEVYYGNTKEDAADIGFRDDMIYSLLDNLSNQVPTDDILKLVQIDRDETIKTFQKFKDKTDKTMY